MICGQLSTDLMLAVSLFSYMGLFGMHLLPGFSHAFSPSPGVIISGFPI